MFPLQLPNAVEIPSFDPGPLFTSSRPSFEIPSFPRNPCNKANGHTKSSSNVNTASKNSHENETDYNPDKISNKEHLQVEIRTTSNATNGLDSYEKTLNDSALSCSSTFFTSSEYSREIQINKSNQTSAIGKTPVVSDCNDVDKYIVMRCEEEASKTSSKVSLSIHLDSPSTGSSHIPTHQSTASSSAPSTNYRFSFPSAYPQKSAPLKSSASIQAHAPDEPRSRHTLQIPKTATTRTSADEAASNSGRFSPTAPNTSIRRSSFNYASRSAHPSNSAVPHNELPPDDNAMLWAEVVRQRRASKRRKKDDEDEDRVIVGTKVDQNHVNWVTAYNMLTGIRFTVSRTNAKIDRPLTDADFEARHKFSFDITGNELTPSAKYDFKFKDYAPWVFRHLRANFKLDPADYLMSLTSKYILSELGSPGKSGSFFYFSRDYKYIIKTIHHAEHKFLRKILKEYFAHVEANPNTLLSQFYGLHRVKMPYGRKIHFVVMNNLFPPHRDIHQTFDLKGSTIGRDYNEENLAKNPRATLKDVNWLRRNLFLEFGPEKRRLFFEQMEKDVHLLRRLGIMDYSMLVGIHNLQIGNQENLRDKTLKVFQPGGDNPSEETERGVDGRGSLLRTPSKLENARKARELRQIIKQEKPIPMGQSSSRMPDTLEPNPAKKELLFYGDDGGFQATHEDNSPGDQIFFLSIIDCLTHYGTIKKLEHFLKGIKYDKRLISPVSPDPYGERFVEFIEGITKSPEEAS
ncbi:Phosphatidylinositol 4-phosphate 5-kinase its3 [Erysiphe neolycopersici]|uniref:1-phosphatidylinositol-4-phosphate 5-kinase n=1 Tax=Erysiphe neolycopersici TaxID=212602 RepID=A0A420HP80_9PEZI|nr:Phosphatidylinositol 4-phosphate 5-kinase its3 [Erysiphe neolycopersici]